MCSREEAARGFLLGEGCVQPPAFLHMAGRFGSRSSAQVPGLTLPAEDAPPAAPQQPREKSSTAARDLLGSRIPWWPAQAGKSRSVPWRSRKPSNRMS